MYIYYISVFHLYKNRLFSFFTTYNPFLAIAVTAKDNPEPTVKPNVKLKIINTPAISAPFPSVINLGPVIIQTVETYPFVKANMQFIRIGQILLDSKRDKVGNLKPHVRAQNKNNGK